MAKTHLARVAALLIMACSKGPTAGGGGVDASVADSASDPASSEISEGRDTASPWPDVMVPDLRIAPPDFGPVPVALPLPPGGPVPRRLLGGDKDQLTGAGSRSCSHQEPASGNGDRWCSFWRPGASAQNTELWVINMTKAAAGTPPPCDGSSTDCQRLTQTLWTSVALAGPGHPYDHAFDGDTLIFYADATSPPLELHRGPVYAWRPGWPAARKLTSDAGLMCHGHASKPIAHCLDDVVGNSMAPDSFELRAGTLEPAPTAPLPSLGRVRPLRSNGQVGWRAAFTADGGFFTFSQPDPDPAVETLRVIATADIGRMAPQVIRSDVTRWQVGNDSRRLYYMRNNAAGERELLATDLAEGAADTKLGARVSSYVLLGEGVTDDGISFLVQSGGDRGSFRIARDSRDPASAQAIFNYRGVLEGARISPDFRYTAWLDELFIGRVVRNSDLGACKLNTHTDAAVYQPAFLQSGGLVIFSQDAVDNFNDRDALYARPDDCKWIQRFATRIEDYQVVGDRGVLYTDDRADDNTVSLKFARAVRTGDDWRLDTPVRIATSVDMIGFTVLGAETKLVLFRTAGAAAGAFVFGPL